MLGFPLILVVQGGCALQPASSNRSLEVPEKRVLASDPAELWPQEVLGGKALYDILLAEIAGKRGYIGVSSRHYIAAALASQDPRLSARAMRITLYAREYAAALKVAKHWIALQPDNPELRRSLVYLSMRTGQGDEALEHLVYLLKTAENRDEVYQGLQDILSDSDPLLVMELMAGLLELFPQDASAHLMYARVSLQSELYVLAQEHAQQAMMLRPQWEDAIVLSIQAQIGAGKKSQALEELMLALKRLPDSLVLHRFYGQLLMLDKQLQAASEQFLWVLSRQPEDADSLTALGLFALEDKRMEVATGYFARMMALKNSARFNAYYYMGLVAQKSGQGTQAEQWLEKVTQGKFRVEAIIQRAALLQQRGALTEARNLLRGMGKEQPQAIRRLLIVESGLLMRAARYEDAIDVFSQGLGRWQNDLTLLYGRAEAAMQAGQVKRAEEDLKAFLELRPEDGSALNTLGYLLLEKTDRYQEAFIYIERALALMPDNQAVIDSMGWAYYRLGNYQQALEYLQQAYAITAEAEIAAHLGEILWMLERQQEAEQIWRDSLQQFPDDPYLQEVMQRFLP